MWASRPTAARVGGAIPVGPKHKFIRRGGIYPARGRSRGIRSPGTMRASSPTEVYYNARTAVSRLATHPPLVVGADSISARGGSRRRGVRRDEGIPPYGRPGGRGRLGWFKTQNLSVGAGFIPPTGVRGGVECGGMRASRPTAVRVGGAIPVGPKHKFIRRGGIYPARGRSRGVRSPGRCEHRPLQGFDVTQGLRFPGRPRARRWL